ncbi:hypothetical protein BH11MYX2_BH11MYX2_26960 [soil metagenome]
MTDEPANAQTMPVEQRAESGTLSGTAGGEQRFVGHVRDELTRAAQLMELRFQNPS